MINPAFTDKQTILTQKFIIPLVDVKVNYFIFKIE